MYIQERKDLFRRSGKKSNPYVVMLLLLAIALLIAFLRSYASGKITPPFVPTPTPTRSVNSFMVEGDTHFQAGDLEKAILSYRQAAPLEPDNIRVRVQLARIMVYSANSLTTDQDKRDRYGEALAVIDEAKSLDTFNPDTLAMRSYVLSSFASPSLVGEEQARAYINEAEAEALAAIQLDSGNLLAKAYYAEILMDQFKYEQARDYIAQARQNGGEAIMDVCRIQAYIYEMFRETNQAIDWYKKAIEITPNLTFLYNRVGVLYRFLGQYDLALEYFAREVNLNKQLGIADPIPYMAIANTYIRKGEAMAASRNAFKALTINPYNPAIYGQVGVIYYKARNYEGAELALKCAVLGCNAAETCLAREEDPCTSNISTEPIPLSDSTVATYYIYGSVLAGLHREGQDSRCELAADVFRQIRAMYGNKDDTDSQTIIGIISASEAICGLNPGTSAQPPSEGNISSPTPSPTQNITLPTETPLPSP